MKDKPFKEEETVLVYSEKKGREIFVPKFKLKTKFLFMTLLLPSSPPIARPPSSLPPHRSPSEAIRPWKPISPLSAILDPPPAIKSPWLFTGAKEAHRGRLWARMDTGSRHIQYVQ